MKIRLTKQNKALIPFDTEAEAVIAKWKEGDFLELDVKRVDKRTLAQNRALHKWCEQIAYTLNKEGLKMTGLFDNDIDWTMVLVKEQIVKKVLFKTLNIKSTTKMKRNDIDGLVMYITAAFGERFGIQIPPFPSRELYE